MKICDKCELNAVCPESLCLKKTPRKKLQPIASYKVGAADHSTWALEDSFPLISGTKDKGRNIFNIFTISNRPFVEFKYFNTSNGLRLMTTPL
jgi:hypothetical protein